MNSSHPPSTRRGVGGGAPTPTAPAARAARCLPWRPVPRPPAAAQRRRRRRAGGGGAARVNERPPRTATPRASGRTRRRWRPLRRVRAAAAAAARIRIRRGGGWRQGHSERVVAKPPPPPYKRGGGGDRSGREPTPVGRVHSGWRSWGVPHGWAWRGWQGRRVVGSLGAAPVGQRRATAASRQPQRGAGGNRVAARDWVLAKRVPGRADLIPARGGFRTGLNSSHVGESQYCTAEVLFCAAQVAWVSCDLSAVEYCFNETSLCIS